MHEHAALARALCQGWLAPEAGAPLDDPAVRQEVQGRLQAVGHRLARTDGGWVSLADAPPEHAALRERRPLDGRAGQLRGLLYLWLVFIPSEAGRQPAAGRGMALEAVVDALEDRGWSRSEAAEAIGAVCAAGWALRSQRRLHPAPALIAVDEQLHEEIAERIIRQHLQRLAAG